VSFWSAVAIALAGAGAGTINTIVGSGTLLTFPTLLFFGVSPLAANVSNTVGLVAGGASGAWGYRHELTGQAPTVRRLMPLSFIGSVVGAALLLILPPSAFNAIVPALIGLALVLVVLGPRIQAWAARDRHEQPAWHAPAMSAGVLVAGMYGGYFGAAQGVLLMGLFSALSAEPLQRLNGYKNVLALVVNLVAALLFVVFAREHIDWLVVLLIAGGSLLGGVIGARLGRRLRPSVLRAVIVVIGLVAVVKLIWFP
jgi:uncharacterized membrane protein YfcA